MNKLRFSKILLVACAVMLVGLGRDPSSVQDLPPGSAGTGTPGPVAAADSPPVVSDKLVSAADQAPAAPEAPAEKEQSVVINEIDADTNEYSERTVGTEESEVIDASEPTLEEWTEALKASGISIIQIRVPGAVAPATSAATVVAAFACASLDVRPRSAARSAIRATLYA